MKKRLLSTIMAMTLAVSMMSGCGSTSAAGSSADKTESASASGSAEADSSEAGSTEAGASASASGDTVKVGLLHSLTGSMAISEEAVRDAEVLAIDEINKSGGVLGKQIEYVQEDGQSDPSVFATKAEKLVDEDQVATVFGCWTSASRKAVKSVFEDYDNLLWYPVQYEGMEDSSNIVYVGAAPNQQIVPAIEYLIKKGYKKYFLMGSDYVFPRTANEIIKAQLKDAGLEVVGEEYADMDQTDFSSIISKIENSGCDVIVNTLNGTGNVSFFKQMAEKNYTSDDYMTMSFSIAEEEVKTIGADILKGHLVSWNYYQTTDTPENEKFVAAYKSAYGEDRVTSDPVEAAYDAVYLWKAAVEKANSFEVDDVLAAIKGGDISFDAPEGKITIDGDNQHCYKKVRVGQVNDQGLIDEVYATDDVVEPDPYLKNYKWASEVQPIE